MLKKKTSQMGLGILDTQDKSSIHSFVQQIFIEYQELVVFSCSVVSDSWRPHGLQHARNQALGVNRWIEHTVHVLIGKTDTYITIYNTK